MSDRPPNRPTVVVVDDDAGVREALHFSLEVEGFDVLTCSNAEDLLELDLPAGPGCLVLDDHLPGMSGMDALETLRGRGVDIPTIVITSAPDPVLRRRALLSNARVVEKPLLNDLLLRAIRIIL